MSETTKIDNVDTDVVNGGEDSSSERMFTESEARAMAEKAVRERLGRESRKHQKELEALKVNKPSENSNVERDYQNKLTDYESKLKQLSDKNAAYKNAALKGKLNSMCAKYDVIDPDMFSNHLLSSKLVEWDDDSDDIRANNVHNDLDDLFKESLRGKEYLIKPKGTSGLGSKQTAGLNKVATAPAKADIKNMTKEEYQAFKESIGVGGGVKGGLNFPVPKPN